jgi:DNA-binding LytR/AlgR family response regulator
MTLRSMIISAQDRAADQMKAMLASLADVDFVATARDRHNAHRTLATGHIDLVFLDAELSQADRPDLTRLADADGTVPYLVLVAANENQACRAFDLGATDFLTRPIRFSRLETAVARVKRAKSQADAALRFAEISQRLSGTEAVSEELNEIWVQRRGEVVRIDLRRVARLHAEGEYVRLFVDGKEYLHREALTTIMRRLDPQRYLRIHRSFAVERKDIVAIRRHKTGSYEALLRDETVLPIGRTHRREVLSLVRHART